MDIDVPGTWVFGTLWKKSQIFLLSFVSFRLVEQRDPLLGFLAANSNLFGVSVWAF